MNSGFKDPTRAYAHKPAANRAQDELERFAPADNLYDAIRADVESIGGIDLEPLLRDCSREPPFNDIDWPPDAQ
jgi:hypothetical protein